MNATRQQLRAASEFFREHVGFSYRPDRETPEEGARRAARRLAIAELRARRAGLAARWEDDDDMDVSWVEPEEREAVWCVEGCTLYRRCECCGQPVESDPLASLWGITNASAEYRRVVEAELALEAQEAIRA